MSGLDLWSQATAWALLHFLWQGLLIWLVTALALRLARAGSAQLRYLIACAGLSLCLLTPVGTLIYLRPVLQAAEGSLALAVAAPPQARKGRLEPESTPMATTMATAARRAEKATGGVRFALTGQLVLVFRCWLLGSLLLGLRMAGGWLQLRQMRRGLAAAPAALQLLGERMARRLGLNPDRIRLALAEHVDTPVVVGWLRPLLLVPVGLLTAMDPVALEALLAHELAHIQRQDYLINLLQSLVEVLLFYHPAVWSLSARIRRERELCCDDAAVAWCGDPLLLAESLTRLQALRFETPALAVGAGGGDLMFRIKRLLLPSLRPADLRLRTGALALVAALVIVLSAGWGLRASAPSSLGSDRWFLAGSRRQDYVMLVDPAITHSGSPSRSLRRMEGESEGFGTVMQSLRPTRFLGRRVRLSAWVKTANVANWAGLWMRVDGRQRPSLAFDNMGNRPLQGTLDWQRYEVVLDVAKEAKGLALGVLLDGPGQVWMDEVRLEVVGREVPVTHTAGGAFNLPSSPDPRRWFMAGSHPEDYQTRQDASVLRSGQPTHLLTASTSAPQGFGTLMQMIKAKDYLGKRVRLRVWAKSEQVENWGGLWMRVDGPGQQYSAFDNNEHTHPIKGTTDWQRYEVVLDVAPDSKAIGLGMILGGRGKVWLEEPTLEVVDASVPSTSLK